MNYIDLKGYIDDFENLYNQIVDMSNDAIKVINDKVFKESRIIINKFLKEEFSNPLNNIKIICTNFIERINSLPSLQGNAYKSVIALFNSYEVFSETLFLLYKENRYAEIREIVLYKPVCCNFFQGDIYPALTNYSNLFDLQTVLPFVTELYLNSHSSNKEQEIHFMIEREKNSIIGFENYCFVENLVFHILLLNERYYQKNLYSCKINLENRALKEKIHNLYSECKLNDLFGFTDLEKINEYIKSNNLSHSQYDLDLFR